MALSHLLREGGGLDAALELELQKQAVAAGGRECRTELDGVCVGRVDVQKGEVAVAQGDEVPAGAEVGLGLDRCAVLGDGEAQLALLARASRTGIELDVVAVRR